MIVVKFEYHPALQQGWRKVIIIGQAKLKLGLSTIQLNMRRGGKHCNELNAWVADNCVPLDMPFLSIIV